VREVEDLAAARHSEVIMLSTMGDEESLGRLRERAEAALGGSVRTHRLINKNYRARSSSSCRPPRASGRRWRARRQRGIAPEEIAAVATTPTTPR